MKLNELIKSFEIFLSNEEEALLETMDIYPRPLSSFTERDQVTINNLIRKSVVSKIMLKDSSVMVMKNDF